LHGTATNQEFIQLQYTEMIEQIKYENEHETSKYSDLWTTKPMLRRTLTGMLVQICCQFTGINVSSYFQPTLYRALGLSGSTVLLITGINGALGTVVTLIFIYFILDRVGRKKPLLFGATGMAISLAIEAAINAQFPGDTSTNKDAQRAGVAFIILFGSLFFSTSFGPVSWVYQSEIFPMRVRAKATAVCTMSNWASNVLISQVSPIGMTKLGYKTKGKSLEEMDEVFGDQHIPHALETRKTQNISHESDHSSEDKGEKTAHEEKV